MKATIFKREVFKRVLCAAMAFTLIFGGAAMGGKTARAAVKTETLVFDGREEVGMRVEIPNYIGETEPFEIPGLALPDEIKSMGYSVFYDETDYTGIIGGYNLSGTVFVYDSLGGHKASSVTGGSRPYGYEGPGENPILVVGNPEGAVGFAKATLYWIFEDGSESWSTWMDLSYIYLTPAVADEYLSTGKLKLNIEGYELLGMENESPSLTVSEMEIPGLKELILNARGETAGTSAPAINVTVNGEPIQFDQPPVLQDGRTLVPLRAIFEALGAEVDWDEETQTVTAVKDDITVSLQIGSSELIVNGESVALDVPAQLIGGRTMVPARAVAESFGADVNWNQETQTVEIIYGEAP